MSMSEHIDALRAELKEASDDRDAERAVVLRLRAKLDKVRDDADTADLQAAEAMKRTGAARVLLKIAEDERDEALAKLAAREKLANEGAHWQGIAELWRRVVVDLGRGYDVFNLGEYLERQGLPGCSSCGGPLDWVGELDGWCGHCGPAEEAEDDWLAQCKAVMDNVAEQCAPFVAEAEERAAGLAEVFGRHIAADVMREYADSLEGDAESGLEENRERALAAARAAMAAGADFDGIAEAAKEAM